MSNGPAVAVPTTGCRGITGKAWWPWVTRAVPLLFFLVIASLLIHQARSIDWGEVWRSLRTHPPLGVAIAAGFAAASHLLYSCFDLLGRAHTGHRIGTVRVMMTTFISYAFNLNFGSLVGGVAFRYRLYSRLGLDAATTSEVLAISMLGNWLGYALLAGLLFALRPLDLPIDWAIGTLLLRGLGLLLVAVALGYLALCAFAPRRTWSLRGRAICLPTFRFAVLQMGMAVLNWALIGAAIYVLLEQHVDYASALSVLLVAAVAGVVTYVPAGLGVLEAVFVALLSQQVATDELLASLLAYRGVYYWGPLLVAVVLHLVLEARTRRRRVREAV